MVGFHQRAIGGDDLLTQRILPGHRIGSGIGFPLGGIVRSAD
jgi:hypothetical protein